MVLINAFGGLPIYLEMTRNHSTRERRKIAQIAAATVLVAIIFFALTGSISPHLLN